MPSISVNAISCAAFAPASRKCAPATEIALNRGTSAAQNSIVSAISRSDGRGGQIQVPRLTYSLRMSFWIVPRSFDRVDALLLPRRDVEREQDRRGAVDREAGADRVERDLVEEDLGVGQRVDRDADPADLLLHVGVIGVVAALGRQIEGDRQAGAALLQQVAVALVGLLGGAEAGVLAECPQPALVAASGSCRG